VRRSAKSTGKNSSFRTHRSKRFRAPVFVTTDAREVAAFMERVYEATPGGGIDEDGPL
jgi:hypothetical protein